MSVVLGKCASEEQLVAAMDLGVIQEACGQYISPPGFKPSYGTAGFRAEASLLPATVFRHGVLADSLWSLHAEGTQKCNQERLWHSQVRPADDSASPEDRRCDRPGCDSLA